MENTGMRRLGKSASARSMALWLAAAFVLGIGLGVFRTGSVDAVVKTYDELETLADVLSIVEQNYVEPVEPSKLVTGAINGMLRSLDPHSSYMTPELYKEMQVETEGEFGGIGIEITIKDDLLTVVAPIEDTPAWRAGIQPGDRIIKVDGTSTMDMTLMDAVRRMRGKKGEAVVITIIREGLDQPKDYSIVRDIIHVASVRYEMLPDNWGYVKIRSFSKETSSDLRKALADLKDKGSRGLILDLRNDPGGLLNQAVEVSEMFLKKGELIVYTRGRIPAQNREYTAQNTLGDERYPMVVLVNRGSASASEIVAGALQDLKRAVLVGTQTFGKGSVQTIIPLKDNAGLRLTTAKYFTPAGRQIQGVGIAPDIVVEQKPAVEAEKAHEEGGVSEKEKIKQKLENGGAPNSKDAGKNSAPAAANNNNGKAKLKALTDLENDLQLKQAIGVLKSWEVIGDVKKAG